MPGPFTESLVERGFLGPRRERRFRATGGGGQVSLLGKGCMVFFFFFPPLGKG